MISEDDSSAGLSCATMVAAATMQTVTPVAV